MTTPAPPLTVAELDSMSNMRANLWPFGWVNRVIAQARRALTLESELAQLRREKVEREGLERRRDEWLARGLEDLEALGRVADERHVLQSSGTHIVTLTRLGDPILGIGSTYEAALAAALDKLEAK